MKNINTVYTTNGSVVQPSTLLTDLIYSLPEDISRQDFMNQISVIDDKLSTIHSNFELDGGIDLGSYKQKGKLCFPLGIPKNHSLTDSLLRTALGCQEKLAKQYMEIMDKGNSTEEEEKNNRIVNTKKRFAQANNHKDFCANSKLHLIPNKTMNLRPVIQNQHESYLKTQLMFLERQKGEKGKSKEGKQGYDKHLLTVTRQISQLGGMEDTVGKMQDSLLKNQIKDLKKKNIIKEQARNFKSNPFSPQKSQDIKIKGGWFERSRQIRQNLTHRLNGD